MRQKSRRDTGSTPLVGSSSRITLGVWIRAHTNPSFCFMPPLRFPASRLRKSLSPAAASSSCERCCALLAAHSEQVGIKSDIFVDGQIFVEPESLRHIAQE